MTFGQQRLCRLSFMKIGLVTALFLVACGGAVSEEPARTTGASWVAAAPDPAPASEPAPTHRRPPPPPPMAFEACASKAVGDACAFDGHEGACIAAPPDAPDDRIVCRPFDAPPCR
jgi:hypothetical protein